MDQLSPQNIFLGFVILIILYIIYKSYIPTKQSNRKLPGKVTLSIFNSNKNRITILDQPTISTQSSEENPIDFASGTPIDINGNGEIAMFINGSKGNDDLLLIRRDNKFINIIDQTNLNSRYATYASVSADIDHDGMTDLVIARENGVFLYLNKGKGKFEKSRLTNVSSDSVPVSLAITDYNKDGNADIFVSQHLHPDLQHKDLHKRKTVQNILLEGKGNGMFEDVSRRVGLDKDTSDGHTVSASWINLDKDKFPDLVMVQDTGDIDIWKSSYGGSGGKFVNGAQLIKQKTKIPTGLGYLASIQPGNLSHDPNLDNYKSNIGTVLNPNTNKDLHGSLPYSGDFMKKQSDTQHIVLRDDPDINVNNIKNDINNGWNVLMEFIGLRGGNQHLDTDIEHFDSYSEINKNNEFWLNISGPQKINLNGPTNNWIAVRLPDDAEFFNANIRVVSINDQTGKIRTQNKQRIVASNSDEKGNILKFDIGADNRIIHLEVSSIYDGNRWVHPDPKINMIATFRYMQSNNYTAK